MDMSQENSLSYYIAVVVVILMAIGTVFVFSASANVGFDIELQHFYDLPSLRQIIFFPLAILIMFLFARLDYHKLQLGNDLKKSPAVWLLATSVVLLMLVLVPKFGTEINQARRWFHINLGFMKLSFQPSELAKWATLFFMVGFCFKYKDEMHLFKKRFLPAISVMAIPVGLIIIEDFGTAALITILSVMVLLIGGANWRHVLAPAPIGVLAFIGAIIAAPHRVQRLAAFWNPEKWADTVAYQANQSLIALGSGGLFGKGIGCGVSKYGHLPEDTTDFIFAIIGEEMGFVGTLAVISLFIVFVWLGIKVVKNCRDEYGKFLAAAIVMTIGVQAALNIGVVTVVLPTKGLPLPFVSAGGTSMLLTAAAVGILLNIAKQIVPKSEPVAASVSSAAAKFQMQLIDHKEVLESLERQAAELSESDELFEREYAQVQEQMTEYRNEHDKQIPPLNAVKKPLKRNAGEPLDTQELAELSGIAKRLAGK